MSLNNVPTLYVITCGYDQAIAASQEQAQSMIAERFAEKLREAFTDKADRCKTERRIDFNAEVTEHTTGATGWTKRR